MAMFGSSWKEDSCSPCGFGDYSCCLCASSGNGCLASMDDNYFTPATDVQLLERVKSGKYNAEDTKLMATILRNHGVTTGDYKWQDEDKCTATDSLAEAINKCNEQLKNKPMFDFSGVKFVGPDSAEQVECEPIQEWIPLGVSCGVTNEFECPYCKASIFTEEHTRTLDYLFCPYCGTPIKESD